MVKLVAGVVGATLMCGPMAVLGAEVARAQPGALTGDTRERSPVEASQVEPGPMGPAPVRSAAGGPVDITVLQTVNLPLQDPEVIVSAETALRDVQVQVRAGGRTLTERWASLAEGQSRSLLWSAPAGVQPVQVVVTGQSAGGAFSRALEGRVHVREPLTVELGPADVDMARRRLRLRSSEPVQHLELSLFDLDGQLIHQAQLPGEGKRRPTGITWPKPARTVARLTVRVFATDDSWADVEWVPVQIELSPPPLLFDGDAATLVASDREKLDALAAEARAAARANAGVRGLTLYILGTSDDAAGQEAVARRARAVARHVKRRGVPLPVRVGTVVDPGFGGLEYIVGMRQPVEADWD